MGLNELLAGAFLGGVSWGMLAMLAFLWTVGKLK